MGTALAHNVGDVVPAENIEPNDWAESVATEGTKAAGSARDAAAGEQAAPQAPAKP